MEVLVINLSSFRTLSVAFRQMHAKRFLVLAHLLFLALSIWLMWSVGAVEFAGGVSSSSQGLPPFLNARRRPPVEQSWSLREQISVICGCKPYLDTSRTIASLFGYMYFSALMRAIDGVWQRDGVSPFFCVKPALFLQPFLFSVLSLKRVLFLWSMRSGRMQLYELESLLQPTIVSFSSS